MRTAATVAQMLVRITGLIQIVLGILFWTGNALALVPLHLLSGLILVLSLWTLAFIAARSGVQPGFVALVFVWGLLLPVFGLTQAQMLVGGAHWVIQVLHLLVGLAAIGQGEGLAARIKRSAAPAVQQG
jgi:hypothetical protein